MHYLYLKKRSSVTYLSQSVVKWINCYYCSQHKPPIFNQKDLLIEYFGLKLAVWVFIFQSGWFKPKTSKGAILNKTFKINWLMNYINTWVLRNYPSSKISTLVFNAFVKCLITNLRNSKTIKRILNLRNFLFFNNYNMNIFIYYLIFWSMFSCGVIIIFTIFIISEFLELSAMRKISSLVYLCIKITQIIKLVIGFFITIKNKYSLITN